jgi:HAD superfamily hydrolase (TIGR01549 family)
MSYMSKKAKLKAILFDMGSTLIEFENSSWDILGRICAERSYRFLKENDLNLPDFKEFIKLLEVEYLKAYDEVKGSLKEFKFEQVTGDFFKALNLNTSDGFFQPFMQVYYQPISDQLTLIDDAEDVLKYFEEKNVKIGLVSNTIFPQRYHLKELERFGLYPYLDRYHFSSEVGVRKPHPEIFTKTLGELNADPPHAVFVGDRLVEDVGGAQKVGMKGILRYHERRDYSAPITPDARIDQLKELPQAVLSLFEV